MEYNLSKFVALLQDIAHEGHAMNKVIFKINHGKPFECSNVSFARNDENNTIEIILEENHD